MNVTINDWIHLCRLYADWLYKYGDLVQDHGEQFYDCYYANECVREAVDSMGYSYDLEPVDLWSRGACPLTDEELNATRGDNNSDDDESEEDLIVDDENN